MRGECKYAVECTYKRYVNGEIRNVTVNECFAEKEPVECNDMCKKHCDKYKPLHEDKLEWIHRRANDGTWYGECARCGGFYDLVEANYCPYCGYEYKPWDGTILGKI